MLEPHFPDHQTSYEQAVRERMIYFPSKSSLTPMRFDIFWTYFLKVLMQFQGFV